jgi:hypothetical protein
MGSCWLVTYVLRRYRKWCGFMDQQSSAGIRLEALSGNRALTTQVEQPRSKNDRVSPVTARKSERDGSIASFHVRSQFGARAAFCLPDLKATCPGPGLRSSRCSLLREKSKCRSASAVATTAGTRENGQWRISDESARVSNSRGTTGYSRLRLW